MITLPAVGSRVEVVHYVTRDVRQGEVVRTFEGHPRLIEVRDDIGRLFVAHIANVRMVQ